MNVEIELAEQFALHTRKHCFITGKAGTGKTTLLKRIVERTDKGLVVVAPTGVAAINAGGVTIHSMFGLPLTCFVPSDDFVDPNVATNRQHMLREHIRFRQPRLQVLREMEMLIIDEVSMVRCDTLDAIDLVLRTVRGNRRPFGDVQVLLFGDMHQLPPVAREAEWNILKDWYRTPYFFDSQVWSQLGAAEIELKTIYRQSDARFVSLLNHVRERKLDADDYALLRARYAPDFAPTEDGYVRLTTHNHRANSINASELEKLDGKTCSFTAQIDGEFPEHNFPCDETLRLKVGAQVMFIRNDAEEGAYYNGKLARVKRIDGDDITVTFSDGEDYVLRRESWENIGYSMDEAAGKIVKQLLGQFSQFPLRLAWAITIHKSQGLTFEKVVIDAGRSFAPGQVYVALSRCRSLEGIVLHSLIAPDALHGDRHIGDFSAAHPSSTELRDVLVREKTLYAHHLLLKLFTFAELCTSLDAWQELLSEKEIPDKQAAVDLLSGTRAQLSDIDTTADKFQRQLQRLIAATATDPSAVSMLQERCVKAIDYFTGQIATQVIAPLRGHANALAYKKKMKRYVRQVQQVEDNCWRKIEHLYDARFLGGRLYEADPTHTKDKLTRVVTSITSSKREKGGTYLDTLDLHRQGKTIEQIAAIRNLAISTVKSHLARWIASGDIDVRDVLPASTIEPVLKFLQENTTATVKDIHTAFGGRYDYNDVRMIISDASRAGAGLAAIAQIPAADA